MRSEIGNVRLYYGSLVVLGVAAATIAAVALLTLGSAQRVDAVAPSLPAKTYEKVRTGTFGGQPNEVANGVVACDQGDRRLSGGFAAVDEGTHVDANLPNPDPGQQWGVSWKNDATVDSVLVVVSCSDLNPGNPPRQ